MAPSRPKSKRITTIHRLDEGELTRLRMDLVQEVENAARRLIIELKDELGTVKAQQTMEETAVAAAHATVCETFTNIGIDISNPIEAQQTFSALRSIAEKFNSEEFQADLAHLQRWRKSMEGLRSKILLTAVGLITAAFMAMMWVAFLGQFKGATSK